MEKVLQYDEYELKIYDDYIIAIWNEGVTIKPEYNAMLIDVAEIYFKNKPFVYITHRLNSYAVDPAIYKETSKIVNLAGFCVVSSDYLAKRNAEIEMMFLNNKPFKIFDDLDDAILWVNKIIANT